VTAHDATTQISQHDVECRENLLLNFVKSLKI
jgi:hypothetical protein